MWRNLRIALLLALLPAVPATGADETGISLAPGAGLEKVQSGCAICHSLDYIQMNSWFQDRAGWEKTVTKMVKVMGAPITPDDAAVIVSYLEAQYGKDRTAPAAGTSGR
jgi:mono/diheme cytochrome c family protein